MKNLVFLPVLLLMFWVSLTFGQKMDVKIIQRQNAETTYDYVVAGYSSSTANGTVNCNAYGNSANCSGSSTTNGYTIPSREGSFNVMGATYSLLLPDGRVAIVNCVRACLRSSEQQSKESQVNHLQAGVQLAFTVLP